MNLESRLGELKGHKSAHNAKLHPRYNVNLFSKKKTFIKGKSVWGPHIKAMNQSRPYAALPLNFPSTFDYMQQSQLNK